MHVFMYEHMYMHMYVVLLSLSFGLQNHMKLRGCFVFFVLLIQARVVVG